MSNKNAVCNTCTLKLVAIAYRRAPWFRLVREPLKLGMRLLVRIHNIGVEDCAVRTPACYNCIRFYKTALKERSAAFRRLHGWINPVFDSILEGIVTAEEVRESKLYARRASEGEMSEDDIDDWMGGMRTGF